MINLHLKKVVLLGVIFFTGINALNYNNDKLFEIAKNLEIFTNIYRELNTHYVDELDPNYVMRSAIDGMMGKMDPYTVYYSESQVESYRINLDEKYSGLGAASMDVNGAVVIKEVYKDGPSDKAGLKAGDKIIRVNGSSTEGRSYEDVLQFLRGFPGSTVKLSVLRPITNQQLDVSLVREEVDMPNVPYYGMLNDHIGYINLSTFTRDASKNIGNALRELKAENDLKGLVLDLRNNGGGLLAEAIDILGLFLPQETPVVSTKGKIKDRDQEFKTRRLPIDTELPIAVMINKYSASASEIVSGSIQDYDRGVVIGQRSYGKGLVQNHRDVGFNTQIKVTTSKYYIPSGRCIQSVAYVNGEPQDIPDDKREVFYTKNKRPVLDGGGVTPDIRLAHPVKPEILKALEKKNIIFDYVTHYIHNHPQTPELNGFIFDKYEDFKAFVKKQDFSYESDVEKSISKLEAVIKERGLGDTDSSLSNIRQSISIHKASDLDKHKEIISREIELDIVARLHYQEGKTRQNLRTDQEIVTAINILRDKSQYLSILNAK